MASVSNSDEEDAAPSARSERGPKLVVIVGTTGVGKTKLGVELAQRLGGEVISADSMQVYKGFSIGSAKVTTEEAQGVPHHLLSIVSPWEEYGVHAFRKAAAELIKDIQSRGKVPIVVGGTFYYVEALLWESAMTRMADDPASSELSSTAPAAPAEQVDGDSVDEKQENGEVAAQEDKSSLYAELCRVDPVMARKLHPNDTRRVRRSLEVFQTTGRRQSDLILEAGGDAKGRSAPAYDSLLIWLDADPQVLSARLDGRVDSMMKHGLLEECVQLYRQLRARSPDGTINCERGVAQSIGFKEFLPVLELVGSVPAREYPELLLAECCDRVKAATRRYAKKQLQWIRTRFQESDLALQNQLLRLNTSDLTQWSTQVGDPAFNAAKEFLVAPPSRSPSSSANSSSATSSLDQWRKYSCEICERTLNGDHEWSIHLQSRGHKKRRANINKQKKNAQKRSRDPAQTAGESSTSADDDALAESRPKKQGRNSTSSLDADMKAAAVEDGPGSALPTVSDDAMAQPPFALAADSEMTAAGSSAQDSDPAEAPR